ncbi:MAG: PAS domain S-box protein [Desulfobacter sp.]|nr:MAG: PAS domain S-box protein [Desulfobacter sp.]
MKKSEQLLSFYLQNTPVGAIYWSRELKVIEWNTAAERIFGYTRKEAMGRHMSEFILPRKEKKLVPHCFQDLVAGRAGGKWENGNVTQAGRLILCDWYNTVLKNESGRTIGVASLVNDITDRKHSEAVVSG